MTLRLLVNVVLHLLEDVGQDLGDSPLPHGPHGTPVEGHGDCIDVGCLVDGVVSFRGLLGVRRRCVP